jgi:hypothetical protein
MDADHASKSCGERGGGTDVRGQSRSGAGLRETQERATGTGVAYVMIIISINLSVLTIHDRM